MMFTTGVLSDLERNHCMSDNLEVVQAENGVLRRKLQSKTEGLMILSKEVEALRTELQKTKQLNDHLIQPKNGQEMFSENPLSASSLVGSHINFSTSSARERNRIALHKQLRTKNYNLQLERENLRQQLEDAKGDIRVFRDQMKRTANNDQIGKERHDEMIKLQEDSEKREEEVKLLEELQIKHSRLKQDLQRLLDEKEDLVREKEDMNIKIHRIHHQLQAILNHDKKKLLDVDHIISENNYLTERLARIQEEKDLANHMGRRYRDALERSKQVKSHNNSEQHIEHLKGLLKGITFPLPQPVDLESISGLETLATSLLETLEDRQVQVKHQRSANRELAARLHKLENKLREVDGGEILIQPSVIIMADYKPGTISEDIDLKLEEQEKIIENRKEKHLIREESFASSSCDPAINEDRASTPDYEDLNRRFENLLQLIGNQGPSENVSEHTVDIVEDKRTHAEAGTREREQLVHYNVSKPPDLLDCIPQSTLDLDMEEEVNITLDGMEIVTTMGTSYKEEQLPDHIQDMVNKAMRDVK